MHFYNTQSSTLPLGNPGERQTRLMMFTWAEHAFTHTYSQNSKKWLPKALLNNIKHRPAIQKHLLEYFHSTKSSSIAILQTKSINMISIQQLFILKLMKPIKKALVAELWQNFNSGNWIWGYFAASFEMMRNQKEPDPVFDKHVPCRTISLRCFSVNQMKVIFPLIHKRKSDPKTSCYGGKPNFSRLHLKLIVCYEGDRLHCNRWEGRGIHLAAR